MSQVGFFSNNNKKAPCSHNNKYDSIYSVQTWCVEMINTLTNWEIRSNDGGTAHYFLIDWSVWRIKV